MNLNHAVISRRQKTTGENHHLWNNNGTWWFHATLHLPDYTSRRVRWNLKTRDPLRARRIRDRLLERFAEGRRESA
jgi:hypothetical protein